MLSQTEQNGNTLPTTFYLKAQPFHLGVEQFSIAGQALLSHGFASLNIYLVGVGVYIAWCLAKKKLIPQLSVLLFVIPSVIYLLSVVGSREISLDGYYWTRWFDPASLMLTVPFCLGWAIIISGLAKQSPILPSRFHFQGN